jgi:hypothetical protein
VYVTRREAADSESKPADNVARESVPTYSLACVSLCSVRIDYCCVCATLLQPAESSEYTRSHPSRMSALQPAECPISEWRSVMPPTVALGVSVRQCH